MGKLGSFIFETLQVVIFAISIFLFVYLLLAQPHKIKGDSMLPNYKNGEYLLTNKLLYRFEEPSRGDVVVFQPPGSESDFIKRIIGLPGEEIVIRDGVVFIDGRELDEGYIPGNVDTNGGRFTQEGSSVVVPPSSYFVLGDNRNASQDSRFFGFVPKGNIVGKAWVVYWPVDMAGKIADPTYAF